MLDPTMAARIFLYCTLGSYLVVSPLVSWFFRKRMESDNAEYFRIVDTTIARFRPEPFTLKNGVRCIRAVRQDAGKDMLRRLRRCRRVKDALVISLSLAIGLVGLCIWS